MSGPVSISSDHPLTPLLSVLTPLLTSCYPPFPALVTPLFVFSSDKMGVLGILVKLGNSGEQGGVIGLGEGHGSYGSTVTRGPEGCG